MLFIPLELLSYLLVLSGKLCLASTKLWKSSSFLAILAIEALWRSYFLSLSSLQAEVIAGRILSWAESQECSGSEVPLTIFLNDNNDLCSDCYGDYFGGYFEGLSEGSCSCLFPESFKSCFGD